MEWPGSLKRSFEKTVYVVPNFYKVVAPAVNSPQFCKKQSSYYTLVNDVNFDIVVRKPFW